MGIWPGNQLAISYAIYTSVHWIQQHPELQCRSFVKQLNYMYVRQDYNYRCLIMLLNRRVSYIDILSLIFQTTRYVLYLLQAPVYRNWYLGLFKHISKVIADQPEDIPTCELFSRVFPHQIIPNSPSGWFALPTSSWNYSYKSSFLQTRMYFFRTSKERLTYPIVHCFGSTSRLSRVYRCFKNCCNVREMS